MLLLNDDQELRPTGYHLAEENSLERRKVPVFGWCYICKQAEQNLWSFCSAKWYWIQGNLL